MAGIQSGSVLERAVLKFGQLFLVADRGGDIKALNVEGHGLYFHDMRHLSLFELDVSGTRLTLLSSTVDLNAMSELQFTNDALLGNDGEVIAEPRTISVRRSRHLHDSLHERLDLVNYNPDPVTMTIRYTCGSDFRDMFDVRGFEVEDAGGRGEVLPIEVVPDGVLFAYTGREGMRRQTRIACEPPPSHIEIVNPSLRQVVRKDSPHLDQRDEGLVVPPIAAAVFEIELPPMAARSLTITATPYATFAHTDSSPRVSFARVEPHASLDATVAELRDSYARLAPGDNADRNRPRAVRSSLESLVAGFALARRTLRRRSGAHGRHSMVCGALWSGRADYRAADALGAPGYCPRHAALPGPPPGHESAQDAR